ncbi:MAG: galactose-1-phosphate uridylyltransferase, partial [Candidatus Aminicenantes bacterium]|nr:galactose-1-phosphate uridylyltransferase [Candidatus Aminicenantes bacterium]
MAEIRKDPFSESVVIYSPKRENRPDFTGIRKFIELSPENCPFCAGNEEMTPPEIYRVGDNGSDWKIRV